MAWTTCSAKRRGAERQPTALSRGCRLHMLGPVPNAPTPAREASPQRYGFFLLSSCALVGIASDPPFAPVSEGLGHDLIVSRSNLGCGVAHSRATLRSRAWSLVFSRLPPECPGPVVGYPVGDHGAVWRVVRAHSTEPRRKRPRRGQCKPPPPAWGAPRNRLAGHRVAQAWAAACLCGQATQRASASSCLYLPVAR